MKSKLIALILLSASTGLTHALITEKLAAHSKEIAHLRKNKNSCQPNRDCKNVCKACKRKQ